MTITMIPRVSMGEFKMDLRSEVCGLSLPCLSGQLLAAFDDICWTKRAARVFVEWFCSLVFLTSALRISFLKAWIQTARKLHIRGNGI